MTPSPLAQLDILDDVMAGFLREKTEHERLTIAHGMWRHARSMIQRILRSENPDWSDAEIQRETAKRLSHGAA